MTPPPRSPAKLREEIGHPVIDADGHILEFLPATLPYIREALGAQDFDRYRTRRRFVYDNPLECFTRQNPSFFEGTSLG